MGGTDAPRAGAGGTSAPDMAVLASDGPRPVDVLPRDLPPAIRMDMAPVSPGAKRALLVVAAPNALGAGDVKIRTRLEAKTFAVTLGDDSDMAANGSGMGMVFISSSAVYTNLMDRFRDVAIPVICADHESFPALRMTGPLADTDFQDQSTTQLTITNAGHTMAAGLMGMATVITTTTQLPWGRPGAGAERVATIPAKPDWVAIFGYPAGSMMVGGTAPARRVGVFVTEPAARSLTPDGEKLLDAAIDWASR